MATFGKSNGPGEANILMLTRNKAVVHFSSDNQVGGVVRMNLAARGYLTHGTANNGNASLIYFNSNATPGQRFFYSNANVAITGVTYSITSGAHASNLRSNCAALINREEIGGKHTNVYILGAGQGQLDFDGYSNKLGANGNVNVYFSAPSIGSNTKGFFTIHLSKESGFEDPDTQQLEARQRGPF